MIINRLRLPKFWQNIAIVFQGALLAQVIPFVSYIVIARIVSPEDFGVFSIWFGIVKLFSVIGTLRLENALVNEVDGRARDSSVSLVIYSILAMSVLLLMATYLIFLFKPATFSALSNLSWFLVVPCAFQLSYDSCLQSWAAADGRYIDLNKIRWAQACGVSMFQLTLCYYFASANSLIIGMFFGSFIALVYSNFLMPVKNFFRPYFYIELKQFWVKHKRFPLYSLPADGISNFVGQLPVMIIGSQFGLVAAGQIALALRMLGAPVGLLGRAVQDVFKRQAALDFETLGNCAALYKKIILVLFPCGLLFLICTFLLSEIAFVFVFGEEWRQAGIYGVWLCPVFALGFIVSPLSYIVYIVHKQSVDLAWQFILLLVVSLSLWLPSEVRTTIFMYSFTYSTMYVFYMFITYKLSLGSSRASSR